EAPTTYPQEQLELSTTISSFGKMLYLNPNKVRQDVLDQTAGTTREEYEDIVSTLPYKTVTAEFDTRYSRRAINRDYKIPVFTKRELELQGLQNAKKALENYSNITLPLSPTFNQLEEIVDSIENGDVLDQLPYNLIEEDYGVTEEQVRRVYDLYSISYDRVYMDNNIAPISFMTEATLYYSPAEILVEVDGEIKSPNYEDRLLNSVNLDKVSTELVLALNSITSHTEQALINKPEDT